MKRWKLLLCLVVGFLCQFSETCFGLQNENQRDIVAKENDTEEAISGLLDQAKPLLLLDEPIEQWVNYYVLAHLEVGQWELAREVIDQTEGEQRDLLFHYLSYHVLRELTDKIAQGTTIDETAAENEFRDIRRQTTQRPSGQFHEQFKRLIESERPDLAQVFVLALTDSDITGCKIEDYESINWFQRNELASIASHHFENQKPTAAAEIIECFTDTETRDRLRLTVHSSYIHSEKAQPEIAKAIAAEFETPLSKISVLLRQGEQAVKDKQLGQAEQTLQQIESFPGELPSRLRRQLFEFVLTVANLKHRNEQPCRRLLDLADQLANGENRKNPVLLRERAFCNALADDPPDADMVYKTIRLILVNRNPMLTGGFVESDLVNRTNQESLEALLHLIECLDETSSKAGTMAEVARQFVSFSSEAAKQLLDEAFELAKRTGNAPLLDAETPTVLYRYDQSRALKEICYGYAVIGQPKRATEVAEMITDQEGSDARRLAFQHIMNERWKDESLYVQNNGQAIFELLQQEQATQDKSKEYRDLANAAGIFAKHGHWENVERFLKIVRDDFRVRIPLSYDLTRQLVLPENTSRIRQIQQLMPEHEDRSFLLGLCLAHRSLDPEQETIEVVAETLSELQSQGRKPHRLLEIYEFLLTAYWQTGNTEKANEIIQAIKAEERESSFLTDNLGDSTRREYRLKLGTGRYRSQESLTFKQKNQIELYMVWISCLSDEGIKMELAFQLALESGRYDRNRKLVNQWMADQPERIRAAASLGMAMGRLDSTEQATLLKSVR